MEDLYSQSILLCIKKLLGISEDFTGFDMDVLVHINSAIVTLYEIGIGPEGFIITGKETTYEDYLGAECPYLGLVSSYLYFKTRLGFDPPTNSSVLEALKEMVREIEWRLNAYVDPETTFSNKKEENSK